MQQALAYRQGTVAQARFNQIYFEYRKAPDVTVHQIYLEAIENVYGSTRKIIIDQSGRASVSFPTAGLSPGHNQTKSVSRWIPLNQVEHPKGSEPPASGAMLPFLPI